MPPGHPVPLVALIPPKNKGNKPCKCSGCGEKFNSKASFWRHKRHCIDPTIVHEKFGFSCFECYRSFRAMDALKSHLKETHGFTRFEMPNFELQENLKNNQSKSTGNVEEKI